MGKWQEIDCQIRGGLLRLLRFFAEVKEYTEGARKEFETSKRFSERYYNKCECLDHDIFQESNLFALKEFQPFLSPILDFIFYYEKGYEAAHPEKEE